MTMQNKMRVLAWPIDTGLNPYTSLLYENLRSVADVDEWPGNPLRKYLVWHMHWPDALLNIANTSHAMYKVSGMFAAIDFLRWRGTKIIWTMHNFASHEALHPRIEALFWKRFIPRVDGIISLSATGLAIALKRFPQLQRLPSAVTPHGHYRNTYEQTTVDARQTLGIPRQAKVIIFFGAVRAYKNVHVLVRAFRNVTIDGALLYIVGKPNSSELTDIILKEAAMDSRVTVKFEFVSSQGAAMYLSASDLVALPYREVLNSGSALMALSCNRPVLVPNLGAMSELKDDFSDAWVRTFNRPLDGSILENALEWATQARPAICPMPERYDWAHIASETLKFYEQVALGSRTGSASIRYIPTSEPASQQSKISA
jgi:beta-1,4-mannosyltransferase